MARKVDNCVKRIIWIREFYKISTTSLLFSEWNMWLGSVDNYSFKSFLIFSRLCVVVLMS